MRNYEVNMKSVVVGNIAENDVKRMDNEVLSEEWLGWLQASNQISDRALFWEGDNKVVVTPRPFDRLWMDDMCQWLGWHNVENICPQTTSYHICDDIMADRSIITDLHRRISAAESVKLASWGSTLGMNRLLENLQRAGNVYAPELLPDDRFDLGLKFDSKSEFRKLCEPLIAKHPQLRIPEGSVCESQAELHQVVTEKFLNVSRPFVIKSGYRSGGSGVLIFRPQDLDKKKTEVIHQEIDQWLSVSDFFPPPYIVEEFIRNDEHISSQLSYHGLVHPNGSVEKLGINGMLIEKEGYKGALIGDLLDPKYLQEVNEIANIIGAAMAEQGYQGRLNIDYVVSESDELYTIEINAGRRSGSVHVFELLNRLQAKNPSLTNVLTYDHFVLPVSGPLSYADIRPVFQNFRDNPPTFGCLYWPLIVSSLQNNTPYLGYMIIGPSYTALSESKILLEQALIDQANS